MYQKSHKSLKYKEIIFLLNAIVNKTIIFQSIGLRQNFTSGDIKIEYNNFAAGTIQRPLLKVIILFFPSTKILLSEIKNMMPV